VVEGNLLDRLRRDVDAEMQLLVDVACREADFKQVNDESKSRRRRMRGELKEVGLDDPNPWPDLWNWYGYYSRNLPSYQERREHILSTYQPLLDALDGLEDRRVGTGIATAATGWTEVDRQVAALHGRYARARTPEDFRQIGLLCRDIFISLGHVIFDGRRHLSTGKAEPRLDDTKGRLELALAVEYGGEKNERLRKLVRSTWEFVQPVVHDRTDDATLAMIAADATLHLQKVLAALFPNPTGRLQTDDAYDVEPTWEPLDEDLRYYLTYLIDEEELEP
jgi:hypothetical protein